MSVAVTNHLAIDPFHPAVSYTEIGSSEIGHLRPATAFQSRMELRVISDLSLALNSFHIVR